MMFVVSAILAIAGLSGLCVGLALYLSELIGPWQAATATGGLVLFTALVLLAIGRARVRESSRDRTQRSAQAASPGQVVASGDAASQLLGALSSARKSDALIASLIAGVVLGACPELRSALVGNGNAEDPDDA